VRLEGGRQLIRDNGHPYFNSYMVRLEVSLLRISLPKTFISIPIWCDWKSFFDKPFTPVENISIPIWCDWKAACGFLNSEIAHFNSYMVRLEVQDQSLKQQPAYISIP